MREMFGDISSHYNLINRLMTFGFDRVWRRHVILAAELSTGGRLLDMGTGTGDLARAALDLNTGLEVIAGDYTLKMIEVGRRRCSGDRILWCCCDALELPFPEATATTEILATGEAGGGQARVLVISMIIGGVYDFLATVCYLWEEYLSSAKLLLGLGERLAEKARFVFKLDATAHLLGLGYIVGIRYAAIIASGSFLSFLVFIPAFSP